MAPVADDGPFIKRDSHAPPGFFTAEARGLQWLGEAAKGVPVARLLAVGDTSITLERLRPVSPQAEQARTFGARLAQTHRAGAGVWGSTQGDGFIGPLPLPNGPFSTWAELWWAGRVEPYLRAATDQRLLTATDAVQVESLVQSHATRVPDESPSRVHGDLWSGNVVWTAHGAVLIDGGAAHGGHREADLAMLRLFGFPHLDSVMAGYESVCPVADGWQQRLPLLSLHPLLVHVVLFGGSYVAALRRALDALNRHPA